MSLVSTFVVMANGGYYQNPVIYDETGDWFICFDDDEPPEFVIRKTVISTSRKDREREISEKLKELGISAKILTSRERGQRNFGAASNDPKSMHFEKAISAFLKLEKRIPLDKIQFNADKVYVELPKIECVVYDPEWEENL